MKREQELRRGIQAGIPICIGYFPAAIAFGLVAKDAGFLLQQALLMSVTNFAGASQFFAVNLIATGSVLFEVALGVFLVNLRYLLMSTSLSVRIESTNPITRALLAFGNTDEVFAVASSLSGKVSTSYMVGIETISWVGWVSGTLTGFLVGSILPDAISRSVGITLYAMFISLLVFQVRQKVNLLLVAACAALFNTIGILLFDLSTGLSFALSMGLAAAAGVLFLEGEAE